MLSWSVPDIPTIANTLLPQVQCGFNVKNHGHLGMKSAEIIISSFEDLIYNTIKFKK